METEVESDERRTNGECLETLFEILLVVGLESRSPSFEFSFEGHCDGGKRNRKLKVRGFKGEERSVPVTRSRGKAFQTLRWVLWGEKKAKTCAGNKVVSDRVKGKRKRAVQRVKHGTKTCQGGDDTWNTCNSLTTRHRGCRCSTTTAS